MLEWITKYWLEVLFGLLCGGIAMMMRHYKKLIINEKKRHEYDLINALQKKMDEQYQKTQCQMDECYSKLSDTITDYTEKSIQEDKKIYDQIGNLRGGLLSIQGQAFKNECHRLLDKQEGITLNEFERAMEEHKVYNNLGGNHEGDLLFEMVEVKYKGSLAGAEHQ